jgi:hypothetical protein
MFAVLLLTAMKFVLTKVLTVLLPANKVVELTEAFTVELPIAMP